MNAPKNTPTAVLRDPQHVVAALPYLLGFTPKRSLVVMGLRESEEGTAVVVTGRYDLPQDLGYVDQEIEDLADHLVSTFVDSRSINSAIITVIDDVTGNAIGDQPHTALVDYLIEMCDDADIAIKDAIYTDLDSVFVYGCDDVSWPSHNVAISQEARDEIAASFVFAGLAPMDSRDDLYAEIVHIPGALSDEISQLIDEQERPLLGIDSGEVSRIATELTQVLVSQEALTAQKISELGMSMEHVQIRDVVMWDLAHANANERTQAREHLRTAVQHLPDAQVAQVVSVLGIEQWMTGDGARANVAIERARIADPSAGLAQLAEAALGAGFPPEKFAQLFSGDLTRDMCAGAVPVPQERDVPQASEAPAPSRAATL